MERIIDEEAIQKVRQLTAEALATRHVDLQRILGESRRARENRLVPEYIEEFFCRACKFLNIPLERRQDGLWRLPNVPAPLRQVSVEFKNRYGEPASQYKAFGFDKQKSRARGGEFVAPGHPLLGALIDHIIAQTKSHLEEGALFEDPDRQLDGWLWFLVGELRDGNNELACRRIFAVYQPAEGVPCGRCLVRSSGI
ncbi:MAG: hypothetical protein NZ899_06055 [Thermoguttaceae bacterium]|nr:hypothetical protein [Thermoguttaceae bacterium]MDW8079502.1 hypothetical protein [Thermoguttaceae bacterium]